MTTIVLVDDHEFIRRGIQAILETEPDFNIVGEGNDGHEATKLIESLHPDVLLLDVIMPGLNGLEVIRRAARVSPNTKVIVLSMYDDEAYVLEALRAGAQGYVLKGSRSEDLVRAIHEVIADKRYLSPPISERAVEAYVEMAKSAEMDSYDFLTDREREILQLTAEGYKSGEIAERLSISSRTADVHRSNLMRKLGLRTHADVIRYALRRGILPSDTIPS